MSKYETLATPTGEPMNLCPLCLEHEIPEFSSTNLCYDCEARDNEPDDYLEEL